MSRNVNAAVPYAIDKAISEGKIKKNSKVLIYAAEIHNGNML